MKNAIRSRKSEGGIKTLPLLFQSFSSSLGWRDNQGTVGIMVADTEKQMKWNTHTCIRTCAIGQFRWDRLDSLRLECL